MISLLPELAVLFEREVIFLDFQVFLFKNIKKYYLCADLFETIEKQT